MKELQSSILEQLDRVECEIAKIRKQAFYRNRIKDTCLLQAYSNGNSSLILNLVSKWKADTVSPIHSLCRYGETRVQFTACISFGDANDMPDRVEAEKQEMFVGDINIVKRPDNRIVPSIVGRPVKLQTLTVLWDRIFGKPKQEIGVSGGLVHAHTRDPRLAAMPKEALEALARAYDETLAKYPMAVLDAPQDAPQNQTESKPAIEAEVVQPETCRA